MCLLAIRRVPGPLCDLCSRDPLYYGGRGENGKPCSEVGSPEATIVLAIVGLAMALVVAVAMGTFFKRRGVKMLTAMVDAAASSSGSTDAVAQETSAQGHAFVGKDTPLARLLELAGRLG
eukprot:7298334-Prymnesium_polylepis.1